MTDRGGEKGDTRKRMASLEEEAGGEEVRFCRNGTLLVLCTLQGDSGGLGLGYVDISSVSFRGYPETELSQHNPVRDHQNHPVHLSL